MEILRSVRGLTAILAVEIQARANCTRNGVSLSGSRLPHTRPGHSLTPQADAEPAFLFAASIESCGDGTQVGHGLT